MQTRRQVLRAGTAALGTVFLPEFVCAQASAADIVVSNMGELSLLQGAGCNVIALSGDAGALMIDGGLPENTDALLAAVLSATGTEQIHTLVNTHWHREHTGANERVGREGGAIFAHEKTRMFLASTVYTATNEAPRRPLPASALPSQTARTDGSMQFAGHQINYGYLPAAHTDGDLYVHFPDLNVLIAGGVISGDSWPLLDYRNGAWYGGRVRALEALAQIVNADTRVVPAHGNLLSGAAIVRQRDMYQALFETLIEYMNLGLGPEDVVARNPLEQFVAQFGDPTAFLDGAYRSMQMAYVPD